MPWNDLRKRSAHRHQPPWVFGTRRPNSLPSLPSAGGAKLRDQSPAQTFFLPACPNLSTQARKSFPPGFLPKALSLTLDKIPPPPRAPISASLRSTGRLRYAEQLCLTWQAPRPCLKNRQSLTRAHKVLCWNPQDVARSVARHLAR